jgi:hypothetical protein
MPGTLPPTVSKERANWVNNMETEKTYLNSTGLKDEPQNNVSPWSTGRGPCADPEPLKLHGYPYYDRLK